MGSFDSIPVLKQFFPFWERLSPEQQQLLLQNTFPVTYEKEEQLHRGALDCIGVLLLKSGRIRSYLLSEDGRDITLYRLAGGDLCLLTASCILKEITFDVFVEAETKSEGYLIPAPVFSRLTQENIYAQAFEYQLLTIRFSDVMWAMQQILFMSFDRRLATFLAGELSKAENGIIRMTHEQIAKYTGSAREVVTRMLKYFANEGIVSLSRGAVQIINPEKLYRLAE